MKNFTKKEIIGIVCMVVLMLAIPAGVLLVQKTQILKSRASSSPVLDAFLIEDSEGNILQCDGSTNPPSCTTSTTGVTMKIKNLDALIQKDSTPVKNGATN